MSHRARRLTCVLALVLGAGEAAFPQTARSAPPRVPAAHRHPRITGDVRRETAGGITLTDTVVPAGAARDELVAGRRRRFDAFTIRARDGFRLFVVDRRTKHVREIRGVPFEWRPFSDLAWADDRTLLFDRWSSPHYGVHYAVDVVRGTLIAAKSFRDD
jgi:hypothetical protein